MNEKEEMEKLRRIIRFEVDPECFQFLYDEDDCFDDASDEADTLTSELIVDDKEVEKTKEIEIDKKYTSVYKVTCEDLIAACENMIRLDVDVDTMVTWYHYIMFELDENIDGISEVVSDYLYLWPDTKKDLFYAIDAALNDLTFYDEYIASKEAFHNRLQEIISLKSNYEYNCAHDVIDWKLTKSQKRNIIMAFVESTNNVPASRRELFKKVVEEEIADNNYQAMYIKGYGCYGGDDIFACDWQESCKLVTKLFEHTGDPIYANTLGYIYYYGRCNGGVPEYEKAFQYFSIGQAYHLLESTYKIADMFKSGKGCIKSPQTYEHIISELYDDCRNQFCHGSEAKFADVALRMASIHMERGDYREALACYLEADFDIKKRMKENDFFGDKKVKDSILAGLQTVKAKLEPEYFQDELVTDVPFWLYGMIENGINAKFTIRLLGDNRYLMTVERRKKDHTGRALIVSNRLERVMLVRKMSFEFVTDEPIRYMCRDKSNMYVNEIRVDEDGEIAFCHEDMTLFEIVNAKYILRKSDFE